MSIINQIEERHNKKNQGVFVELVKYWVSTKKGRGCAFEQEKGGGLKEWDF